VTTERPQTSLPARSDLHVTVIVARDDATGLPAVYLRDRVSFADPEQGEAYTARLLAWVARRPLPDDPELPLFLVRWRPGQLDLILDRMDQWAPFPDPAKVYDREEVSG
jgi:hypothetical protein